MPVIKVSFPPHAPFFYYKDGQPHGYCYDMVNTMFDSIYTLEIEDLPLNRIFRRINSGKLDLVGCMPCNVPGMESVEFSEPYIRENIIVFYNKPSKLSGLSIESLQAYNGATIRGAITERYLSSPERFLLDSSETLIEMVDRNRADYGVIPKSIYNRALEQYKQPVNFDYHVVDVIKACAGVSKSSPVAKQMGYINQWLASYPKRESETTSNKATRQEP